MFKPTEYLPFYVIVIPWVVAPVRGRTGGQVWYNYFTACISVDLAHHKILRAKVGKGGISHNALYQDIRHYMHVLCEATRPY